MLDELILKVGVATDPAAFAGAIYKNIKEGKRVSARAFGASANYTMCKGIAIAQDFFRQHGEELFCQISTRREINVRKDDGEERDIRSFTAHFYVIDGKHTASVFGTN